MLSDDRGPARLSSHVQVYLDQVMQVSCRTSTARPALSPAALAAIADLEPPRIGVFGGTFDPIHIGHLLLAQEAAMHMALDRVYFVPAGQPPHKPDQPITSIRHRLAMADIATQDNTRFAVSRLDANDQVPSYTVELIRRIHAPLQLSVQTYFLMGMDSLQDLVSWYQPDWLVDHCNLVALSRPTVQVDWSVLEQRFPHIQQRVTVLDMPGLDVSGMNVRDRLRTRHPIRYLVPPAVIQYIQEHALYTRN